MENATKALELAAAVIVFVMALSLSVYMFSQARATSETVLQASDATQYYSYTTAEGESEFRIVGFETVIPTLYKYEKERYKVVFKHGTYDYENNELIESSVKPQAIYTTKTTNWKDGYSNDFSNTGTSDQIYIFDISEENDRGEPWILNRKANLDNLFSGKTTIYHNTLNGELIYDYSGSKLNINTNSKQKFIEQVGRITTTDTTENGTTVKGNKTTTKTVITYILIDNKNSKEDNQTN